MLTVKVPAFFCVYLISYSLCAQNPSGMIVPADSVMKYKDTSGGRDIIGVLSKATHIHIKKPPSVDGKRVYYSLLPLGTSVPGGGTALITATTAGFYLGPRATTNLSTITFSPSTNFKGQWNIPFHANIWNPNNTWNYSGDVRLTVYPQYTWGLGGNEFGMQIPMPAGSAWTFAKVDFGNATPAQVAVRLAADSTTTPRLAVEVWVDAPTTAAGGRLLATVDAATTGNNVVYATFSAAITTPIHGVHDIVLKPSAAARVNWFVFGSPARH